MINIIEGIKSDMPNTGCLALHMQEPLNGAQGPPADQLWLVYSQVIVNTDA